MTKRPDNPKFDLEVGDFTRRAAFDGKCSALVVRKTGPRYDDVERHTLCRTDEGAIRLAALMNAARDLARDWREIAEDAPQGRAPEQWVHWIIVKAVATAIAGPVPELPMSTARPAIPWSETSSGFRLDIGTMKLAVTDQTYRSCLWCWHVSVDHDYGSDQIGCGSGLATSDDAKAAAIAWARTYCETTLAAIREIGQ